MAMSSPINIYTHYFFFVVLLINFAFLFISVQVYKTSTNRLSVKFFGVFFALNVLAWLILWSIETGLSELSLHANIILYILTHLAILLALNALCPHQRIARAGIMISIIFLLALLPLSKHIDPYDIVALYSLPIDLIGLYILNTMRRIRTHEDIDLGLVLIAVAIIVECIASLLQLMVGWYFQEQALAYKIPIISGTIDFFLVGIGFITSVLTQDKRIISNIAQRDPLTGLLNRRGLQSSLARQLSQSKTVAIVLMDIDYFKLINDDYGHDAGDSVLKNFAKLIAEGIRKHDLLARVGGEEFLLILPDVEQDAAVTIAEKLRTKVELFCFTHDDTKIPVTVSLGITVAKDEFEFDKLTKQADMALYQAKNSGRNRVVLFDQLALLGAK